MIFSGVKQGSVKGHRICRSCNISSKQLQHRIRVSDLESRNHDLHVQRCNELEHLAGPARKRFSRIWGLKSRSIFLKLPYLDISLAFPVDPMHSLHINSISYATALILQRSVEKKWISLEYLNSRLFSFPYSYLDKDHRPSGIERKHIFKDLKLKQNARSLMLISQILPLLIFNKIPEEDPFYRNWMRLIAFSCLCCSSMITLDTIGSMQELLEEYLLQFKRLHPELPIRQSQHDLLHLCQQAIRFGPPKVFWCYSHERKNNVLKKYQKNCFKNPPLSLMRRNQIECCYNSTARNFLTHADEVKDGKYVSFFQIHPDMRRNFIRATCQNKDIVYATRSLTMNSIWYQRGVCIMVDWPQNWPNFCRIEELYVLEPWKLALVTKLYTKEYNWRVNAYSVDDTEETDVILLDDLVNPWPIPAYRIGLDTLLVNRNAHFGGGFF